MSATPSTRVSATLAEAAAVRAALRVVLLADARVLLAALRAWLPWRVALAFLAVARRWTWVWLLRALVLRARELVVRLRDALVLRALLERVVGALTSCVLGGSHSVVTPPRLTVSGCRFSSY